MSNPHGTRNVAPVDGANWSPRDALVVVAHPDDEVLWALGFILANPGTHILCCSVPKRDPERIGHFFNVCKAMKADGFVAGKESHNEKINYFPAQCVASDYHTIITHNQGGEYGHKGHQTIHNAMAALNKEMWVFGFGWNVGKRTLGGVSYEVDIERKKALLAMYTSRPNVFANQSKNFDLSKECLIRFR